MRITIKPTGNTKKHLRELEISEFRFRKGVERALFDIGFDAAREAEMMINNEGRDGRLYITNGLPHVASSPGDAPANLSGRLKKSMNFVVRGDEVEWGSTAGHAVFLELGTRKMDPRPFLAKVEEMRGELHATMLEERVDREIKRRS